MPGTPGKPDQPNPSESDLQIRVAEVIEMIRPAVHQDGGDVELMAVTPEGEVQIRFLGACVGCPSSEITLRDVILRHLRDRVPEISAVVAID